MKKVFLSPAWEDYLYWQQAEKSMLRKINSLIREIKRHPFEGTGNWEPLKHVLAVWEGPKIELENRLVYRIEGEPLIILQCRFIINSHSPNRRRHCRINKKNYA